MGIMNSRDPLQCTFEDARRNTLLVGMALDTSAKVAFFEEMVSLAHQFDARDRLAEQAAEELIAFKLQAHVNDPRRLRDVHDIRELLRTNRESLDFHRSGDTLFSSTVRPCSMTSSPNSACKQHDFEAAPFAASGGAEYVGSPGVSSVDAWMDLMETVEALCPRWPKRELSIGTDYRL